MPSPNATHIDVLYLHHREQIRHSLAVLARIAKNAAEKGEHQDILDAGKSALVAVEDAENGLRVADKHFREIGLERKDGVK